MVLEEEEEEEEEEANITACHGLTGVSLRLT